MQYSRRPLIPKISEFYGIKIFIYWNDQNHHNLPHFHAIYNEYQATFDLTGNIIIGNIPVTAKKLVKIWALENKEILYYTWSQALLNKPLPKIKGLK